MEAMYRVLSLILMLLCSPAFAASGELKDQDAGALIRALRQMEVGQYQSKGTRYVAAERVNCSATYNIRTRRTRYYCTLFDQLASHNRVRRGGIQEFKSDGQAAQIIYTALAKAGVRRDGNVEIAHYFSKEILCRKDKKSTGCYISLD